MLWCGVVCYVHVCVHVYVCACACVCARICVGACIYVQGHICAHAHESQRLTSGIFLDHPLPSFLRYDLSLNQELTDLLLSPISLRSQYRNDRYISQHPDIYTDTIGHTQSLGVGSKI